MRSIRYVAAVVLALSGAMAISSVAGASHGHGGWWGHHRGTYTCNGSGGGVIPPGSYGSVVVTGVCYAPAGNITIARDLTIAPGGLLDAVTPGDPTATPAVPAVVTIGGNVWVGKGAALLLGCSPNISCAPPTAGNTFDTVRGNLTAVGAQGVVLHNVSVGGNVSVFGGGGSSDAASCDAQMPSDPTNPALTPWSEDPNLDFTPVYTDFEDGSVGGNLRIVGLNTCWTGSLRNWVSGSFIYGHNTFGDPDASEIGNNLIFGNFGCFDNSPAPQFGDGAAPDLVRGHAWGQCTFQTVLQNPAQEAITSNMETGVGVEEHFVVSLHSLTTSTGTHTLTPVGALPGYPVTTSSGDSIFADLNSFTLAGSGLTGTATYTGGAPGQAPGEALLGTTFPNGWAQFIAYDTCETCSYAGQTGPASLRAYGVTSPSGNSRGVFVITSGGTVLPTSSSPVPGLATLTGWGTFSGNGATLNLVEHLGFG
jgi:hypothetical protein